MAAVLTLHANTGSNAGTESSAVTGIDLCSIDTALNTSGNRASNPITASENSFEKWLTLKIGTAPDNGVTNFQVWTDGSVDSNTTLYGGETGTGVTPTASTSSVATTDMTGWTSGAKHQWDSASYTTIGNTTDFLVMQLDTTVSASAGDWTQETINYSYDET